jgi:hypothetical protein
MNVTIPSELLGGKFHLKVDRGDTEDFLIRQTENYTTISFSKFISCPDHYCDYEMDIYGTEVISEFGSSTAIIIGAVLAAIVVIASKHTLLWKK